MVLLDIKTLMVCNGVFVVFVCIALVIYWSDQKTYFGFGMWVAAAALAVLGYATLVLRGVIPVWVSIFSNNTLFLIVGLLRLDGIIRFLSNRRLAKKYYLVPVPVAALCAYYYFVNDQIAIRAFILAIPFFLISLAAFRKLTKYAPQNHKRLYWSAAILSVIYGASILARSLFWLADPNPDIFHAGVYQILYFLIAMIFEVGIATLFFMMNSQRTEDKLIDAQNELHATVADLETALSEIKTLSGLLPICSVCKKIRDDKGYWNQIESYIRTHSSAEFSHGICPDCLKKLYPDIADEVLAEVANIKRDDVPR